MLNFKPSLIYAVVLICCNGCTSIIFPNYRIEESYGIQSVDAPETGAIGEPITLKIKIGFSECWLFDATNIKVDENNSKVIIRATQKLIFENASSNSACPASVRYIDIVQSIVANRPGEYSIVDGDGREMDKIKIISPE